MSDSKNVNVEGSIDAGFTQYGVPKQTSEDENGNIETTIWPEHIDPEELTDTQREILRTALSNPTLSITQVEDKTDVSPGYASKVLRKHVPDWYQNTFKSENGKKRSEWAQKEDDKRVDQHDSGESETQETDVQEILEVLKKTAVHQETKNALEVLEGYL